MTKIDLYKIPEIELTYKRKVKADDRPKISSSWDAYKLFRENWDDLTINLAEEFKIMLLDRNNRCMGIVPISKGGVSGTVVDPKLIFASALKARACAIILGHNHPSGNTKHSRADKEITDKLVQGGQYLDLKVLDHIIVTDENYLSFADEGLTL
ncbi:JAB domain-containing protein [Flavivirga sp. 57AJ16]|uniref:JAB domain-containing protein n=1 Tax=Flavivirga sp. 57AJ16 TaxID=3025307 RepID=UPI0023656645|nr:JAB domain-containing protein [Flavivirga sp. 57AJ16]MDD7887858.1 JAB domain-containing protein [Flavivirga sp. 57AJ16]